MCASQKVRTLNRLVAILSHISLNTMKLVGNNKYFLMKWNQSNQINETPKVFIKGQEKRDSF